MTKRYQVQRFSLLTKSFTTIFQSDALIDAELIATKFRYSNRQIRIWDSIRQKVIA